MTTIFETEPCSRCGGTGQFSFNGEHSRCYKCDGKNGCRAYTKRGRAAKEFYETSLMVATTDVVLGMKLRHLPYVKQITVAKIEIYTPTSRVIVNGVEAPKLEFIRFTNEKGVGFAVVIGSKVRRLPTEEENEVLKAAALAYQETLTKSGKPRKRG